MWVRLKCIQQISERGGKLVIKYPGEWVEVGKQQALAWIAEGCADRPDQPNLDALPGCGVVTGSDAVVKGMEMLKSTTPVLEFPKTLLWSGVNFRRDLLASGFHLLDMWEIAVPLLSYDTLARDVGSEQERDKTKQLIHDLRVPVYDTRLMFVRRCDVTRKLIKEWLAEKGNRELAFLRVLYRVKPLILALPTTWVLP